MEAEFDERLTECVICGSPDLRFFDRDHKGYAIEACRSCGIKFMNPQYSDRDRERFYSHYIGFHDEPLEGPEVPMRSWTRVREEKKRRCIQLIGKYVSTGRFLSVGCGDGVELGIARELGWEAEGYDVDPGTTAEVSKRTGAVVHSGDFADLDPGVALFDVVYMDQVIEHLKNPNDYLTKITTLLRPGGVLFLGMPNLTSLSNRTKTLTGKLGLRREKRGNHYASDHHIIFFSPRALRSILEDLHGFEVLCMRGSLEPQKKKLTPLLSRWFPNVDSSFIALARKPER